MGPIAPSSLWSLESIQLSYIILTQSKHRIQTTWLHSHATSPGNIHEFFRIAFQQDCDTDIFHQISQHVLIRQKFPHITSFGRSSRKGIKKVLSKDDRRENKYLHRWFRNIIWSISSIEFFWWWSWSRCGALRIVVHVNKQEIWLCRTEVKSTSKIPENQQRNQDEAHKSN